MKPRAARASNASLIVGSAAIEVPRRRTLHRPPPQVVAAAAVALAWGGVLAAALLAPAAAENVTGGIIAASSGATTRLGEIADALPLGYAFGAGMVAAVNPCGFALLSAYLGLTLGTGTHVAGPGAAGRRILRSLWIGLLVTLGFVLLFGVAGLTLNAAYATFARALPWLGVAIGTLLVLAGGLLLGGGSPPAALAGQLAGRLGGATREPGARGYLAYGLAYGLASLGCALPIFLAVVGSSLTADGLVPALRQFLLYALGMGSVVTTLTLLTAFAREGAVRRARRIGRYVGPLSALLLVLAGAYVMHYWLTLGGVLDSLLAH